MLGALVTLGAALVVQAPDTARAARYAAALHAVSDSLDGLRGTAAAFRRDLATASRELVDARARRMRQSCSGALRAAADLDGVLASGPYSPATGAEQTRARRELVELRRALIRCQRDFDPGPKVAGLDTVKAWGPFRLAQLDGQLRRYQEAALRFAKRAGFR